MVRKPISIMILPVFVAAVLIMSILATISSYSQVFADKSSSPSGNAAKESSNSGNTEETSNTGNRQHTFLPETEENNAHFAQENNNHPMCLNEHTEKWEPCVVKNSPQKQESSNTPSSQESSNTGKEVKESSNTEQTQPVRPAMTLTPIQAHITTKAHMTATNEQLSNNGKATTPTPTGPTVAPRVEGAKTIAEVQQLKKAEAQKEFYKKLGEQFHKERMSKGIKFNPSNEACEGATASEPGKVVCLGKVVPRPINPENLAMHPSTTVHHMGKGPHGAALTSNAGLGGLVKPAGHLAKIIHKVGNETLEAGKALLGINGK